MPPVDRTVRLLVEQSQNGDKNAFEKLVKLYQNRVYALCFQLTSNHSDAQDLAQEAFVKAYISLKSFRNEADFGTWLHRITVNLWINIKRRRKPEFSLDETIKTSDGELSVEVAADTETPEESLERREFGMLVRSAFQELSEEHRAVLLLREMYGYNYDEIATMTNCSLGTVKSRINRARQSLKKKVTGIAKSKKIKLPYDDKK